jgi:hypothetical protein
MNLFSLSQLSYPYPDLIHPNYVAMEEYAAKVIDEYTEIDNELMQKIKKASPGELIARFYPFANSEQVNSIIRYLIFTFVIEDTYSRLPFDVLQNKCKRVNNFIDNPIIEQNDEMVIRQLNICLHDARKLNASPQWLARFSKHNQEFIESILTETTFYEQGVPIRYPSIEECMRHREDQVAGYPFIDYIDLVLGITLPETVYQHPHIQRLWKLILYFIVYVNDLYSIEKDVYNKEIMNVALVIQHTKECSLEEAKAETLRMHDESLDEFESLCSSPPDFGKYNEQVRMYIDRLRYFVQANLSWHKMSRRYFEYT